MSTTKIYDNGGKTLDRYTVVFTDRPERQKNTYEALGMSEHPFHGIGQHCVAVPGTHLGKRITFDALPPDCKKFVLDNLHTEVQP